MRTTWSLIGLAGLVLAVAEPAAAQGAPGDGVADRPMTARQNGRTVASTRTDSMGAFRFDLMPGVYELCVGAPTRTPRQTLPDRGPRAPGNGGRAGGQALAGGGGEACFPHTVALPDNGSRRSEPVPIIVPGPNGEVVAIRQPLLLDALAGKGNALRIEGHLGRAPVIGTPGVGR